MQDVRNLSICPGSDVELVVSRVFPAYKSYVQVALCYFLQRKGFCAYNVSRHFLKCRAQGVLHQLLVVGLGGERSNESTGLHHSPHASTTCKID